MKLDRSLVVFPFLFVLLFFFSCPNKGQHGKQSHDTKNETAFVKITPPKDGIIGDSTDLTFPTNEDFWRGIFVKGRVVKLTPFYMARHEVSYKLWKEVYDWAIKNDYKFKNAGKKGGALEEQYKEEQHTDMEPVTSISWMDCIVWCNAYTEKKDGNDKNCVYQSSGDTLKDATNTELYGYLDAEFEKTGFRLPTEAEWEFCARYQGNDSTNAVKLGEAYYTRLDSASGANKPVGFKKLKYEGASAENKTLWDAVKDEASRVAVYRWFFNGEDFGGDDFDVDKKTGHEFPSEKAYSKFSPDVSGTREIGSKAPNSLGLFDMSGNVTEFVYDEYRTPPLSPVEETDPDAASSTSPYDGLQVVKGASWAHHSLYLGVGYRTGVKTFDNAGEQTGFRLVHR